MKRNAEPKPAANADNIRWILAVGLILLAAFARLPGSIIEDKGDRQPATGHLLLEGLDQSGPRLIPLHDAASRLSSVIPLDSTEAEDLTVRDRDRMDLSLKGRSGLTRMPERWIFIAGRPMDVNSVTIEELGLLPKVGKVWSERILNIRKERGGFSRMSELLSQKGLPRSLIPSLKQWLATPKAGSINTNHEG